MKTYRLFSIAWLCALLFCINGCSEPHQTQYEEWVLTPATQTQPVATVQWTLPEGWTATSETSGMRVASFAPEGVRDIDCSLVQLAGDAGGLEANIQRWVGQLGFEPLTPERLEEFLRLQTHWDSKHGDILQLDLSRLQSPEQASEQSMLIAISRQHGQTLFLKMTGPIELLQEHQEAFKALALSLEAGT